jgi:hypothetical protein
MHVWGRIWHEFELCVSNILTVEPSQCGAHQRTLPGRKLAAGIEWYALTFATLDQQEVPSGEQMASQKYDLATAITHPELHTPPTHART